jgi:hypothetical protein
MNEDIFLKDWIADGSIVRYRFTSTGSEAAERWYEDVVRMMSQWDASKPGHVLIDVSQVGNSLSAQALKRTRDITGQFMNVPGRTAVLIDPNATAYNINAMLAHSQHGARQLNVFSDEADAVTWLLEPGE